MSNEALIVELDLSAITLRAAAAIAVRAAQRLIRSASDGADCTLHRVALSIAETILETPVATADQSSELISAASDLAGAAIGKDHASSVISYATISAIMAVFNFAMATEEKTLTATTIEKIAHRTRREAMRAINLARALNDESHPLLRAAEQDYRKAVAVFGAIQASIPVVGATFDIGPDGPLG